MNKEFDVRVFNHHLIDNPSNDIGALLDKTRNAQMYTFFEIFKHMMNTFPSPVECDTMIKSNNHMAFFNRYINPLVKRVNELKNQYRSTEIYDDEWFEKMNSTGLVNPDLIDLLDTSPEKIVNPTLSDIVPDIEISLDVFTETAENGNIQFPYETIPMLCMIPSVTSIYDKHDDMSRLYYKVQKERDCFLESPILEISLKSLLMDYASIYSEYNTETKIVNPAGLALMKRIIEKYSDFSLPLIFITLRKDYEFTESYTSRIYNFFTNNYQSAIVANKYMNGITNALIYSKLGHDLIHLLAFTNSTSTIDLLNPNDPYRVLLNETIVTASGNDSIRNYIKIIETQNVDFSQLVEDGIKERLALDKLMSRLFNIILSILSESISLDGNYQINEKLLSALTSATSPLSELTRDCVVNAVGRALLRISDGIKCGNIRQLTKTVAEVQSVRTFTTSPGVRSNRSQFTPIAQQILSGTDIQQYNFIGNNSAALECVDMMKEINRTKTSNSAMRMLATECENIKTLDDAYRITFEAKMFKEALNHSRSRIKTEDTEIFRVFLNNVTNEVEKWKESESKLI